MNYSISEFAERLGITVDTIRFYEKHGIIQPIKNKKNNYRYFSDEDARSLLMSRWYRSLDIPVHDVSLLITNPSVDSIVEKIQNSEEVLSKQIQKSTLLLNKIMEIKQEILALQADLNTFKLKKIPGIYRLKHTVKNALVKNNYQKVNHWVNLLPYSYFSLKIELNEFLSGEKCFEYDWGLALSEEDLDKVSIVMDNDIEYFGPKTCLSTVILHPFEENITRDALEFVVDYIEDNKYYIAGDIHGKLILTDKSDNWPRSYIEINIPIDNAE